MRGRVKLISKVIVYIWYLWLQIISIFQPPASKFLVRNYLCTSLQGYLPKMLNLCISEQKATRSTNQEREISEPNTEIQEEVVSLQNFKN